MRVESPSIKLRVAVSAASPFYVKAGVERSAEDVVETSTDGDVVKKQVTVHFLNPQSDSREKLG